MYESHFGLNKKPFQITTDPRFLWLGKSHREALNTLKFGVIDNKGLILLTGDMGTGKTALINRLLEDIKDKAYTAKIPDPRLSKYDFFRMVSRYFKLPIDVRTQSDFINPFTRFLRDAHLEKKPVLLIVDEAQRLKQDLIEEIRLLANLEYQSTKLLNIFFVGQKQIHRTLLQPENRSLMRRITITCSIDPLTLDETGAYIRHRLEVAGAGHDIFSAGAVEEIYDFSAGLPRKINIIGDLAMLFAFQLDQRIITPEVVRQCRERISFSPDDAADAPRKPIPTSHNHLPSAGTASSRRFPLTVRWVTIAVALLLACGAGIYFSAPKWKNRVRQWIQHMNWSTGQSSNAPAVPSTIDHDAGETFDSH